MEEIRRSMLIDCLTSCMYEKLPSGIVPDTTKPKDRAFTEKCTAFCDNEYKELKNNYNKL
jgi:hypothetical protein